jgi:hypothetical protein
MARIFETRKRKAVSQMQRTSPFSLAIRIPLATREQQLSRMFAGTAKDIGV